MTRELVINIHRRWIANNRFIYLRTTPSIIYIHVRLSVVGHVTQVVRNCKIVKFSGAELTLGRLAVSPRSLGFQSVTTYSANYSYRFPPVSSQIIFRKVLPQCTARQVVPYGRHGRYIC